MSKTGVAAFFGLALLALPAGRASAREAPVSVAKSFYDAYCKGDMATLEKLYDPKVKWSDTITSFGDREGTMGMWRALAASHASYSYRIVSAQGDKVVVNWLADYQLLGNPVHNDVMATLVIKDGRIVQHTDAYSWDRWAAQVFPRLGALSSWPPAAWALRGFLGAALHVQSAVANAKLAAKAPPAQGEGFVRKLGGALGR